MRHFLSIATVLSLAACQTGVAPANDDYKVEDIMASRSTALGIRTTLEAPNGVWDFGNRAALTDGSIVVSEKAQDATCDNRLRVYTPDITNGGHTESTYDCTVENPFYGDVLAARDAEIASGADAAWVGVDSIVSDGALVAADGAPGDAFGASNVALAWDRIAVGAPQHGVSGAVYIFEFDSTFGEVAKLSHPGVAENGGFGTKLLGDGDVLVAEDGFARQFVWERSESGNWLSVDGPGGRILAMNGNTALVEPATGADLRFYDRANGAWTATGVLHDARLPYTEWVFDDVAAFAVQQGAGNFRGIVDRYTRIDGELDATVRLTLDHTGVDLDLEGNQLLVSEALSLGTSGNGRVHVFDWTEDRTRMLFEKDCPAGDDAAEPNEGTLEAHAASEGTFIVTTDSEDFFTIGTVEPGQTITLDLTNGDGDDVDVYLWDGTGAVLDSGATSGTEESVSWTNDRAEAVEVFAKVNLFSGSVCAEYTFTSGITDPVEPPPAECAENTGNDTFETASELPSAPVTFDSTSATDWYQFSGVFVDEQITATLTWEGETIDLDLCLKDSAGTELVCSLFDTPESLVWHNTTGADVDAKLEVVWWEGTLPADGEPGACVDYTLDVEFETIEPEPEPEPETPAE